MTPLNVFEARKAHNLTYFQTHHVALYEQLIGVDYKALASCLPTSDQSSDLTAKANPLPEVTLLVDGQPLYPQAADAFVAAEVHRFLHHDLPQFWQQLTATETHWPAAKDYPIQRFFIQQMSQLLSALPDEQVTAPNCQESLNYLPALAVVGIGCGYHIEQLQADLTVGDLAIFEQHLSLLAFSLYHIDWHQIAEQQQAVGGRLSFYIGTLYHPALLQATVWNHWVAAWPHYPLMPAIYWHQTPALSYSKSDQAQIEQQMWQNRSLVLASWGNYDDELNQIMQGLDNLQRSIRWLSTPKCAWSSTAMACVVGSGPSLDDRMALLKQLRPHALLISCGTSITALYEHGLVPDLHVEIESDLTSGLHYLAVMDSGYTQKIPLIAAIAVNQQVTQAFKTTRFYRKKESALAHWPMAGATVLAQTGPTCTNAGVRLASEWGVPNILFFGMDLGYVEGRAHHAQSSAYFNDKTHPDLVNAGRLYQRELAVTQSRHGRVIVPKMMRNTRHRLEQWIRECPNQSIRFFNCSDGVDIEGAVWLSDEDCLRRWGQGSNEASAATVTHETEASQRQALLHHLFGDQSSTVAETLPDCVSPLLSARADLDLFSQRCLAIVSQPIRSLPEWFALCLQINQAVEHMLQSRSLFCYRLLRGSMGQLCYAGVSHAARLLIDGRYPPAHFYDYAVAWQKRLSGFLQALPDHFSQVTLNADHEFRQDWLSRSFNASEPNLDYPRKSTG